MAIDFEKAAVKYRALQQEIEAKEAEVAAELAPKKQLLKDIETWFALKAQEEGLIDVRTKVGLVYWSTHSSATIAEPSVFKDFVVQNNAWDLLDARASRSAVKSYVEGNGAPPPGVNYSTRRVFNLRKNPNKE